VKREIIAELLDSDSGDEEEIARALEDLRRINRWFGGTSTMLALLDRVIQRTRARELSLLDVASGSADVPTAAAEHARKRSVALNPTVLDLQFSHIKNHARSRVVGDALRLPFKDDSFDLVSCSLFAHHLEPAQFIVFAREARRVARQAVLVNDLVRSRVHLALVYAGLPLWRSAITRHDSLASVRRSYVPEEMRILLERSGAFQVEIFRHYLFRMGVIAWKCHV
jgi:Methyltransferase domain